MIRDNSRTNASKKNKMLDAITELKSDFADLNEKVRKSAHENIVNFGRAEWTKYVLRRQYSKIANVSIVRIPKMYLGFLDTF